MRASKKTSELPDAGWDFIRQGWAVPGALRDRPVVIIGCGTTGSWALQLLAREKFQKIGIFDGDTVEDVNMPGQAFMAVPAGTFKVDAAFEFLRASGPPEALLAGIARWPEYFDPVADVGVLAGATVFACVDSAEARLQIADAAEIAEAALVDIRMGTEDGSVFYVPPMSWAAYRASLHPTTGFVVEPTCGARAVPTTAFALVAHAIGRWVAAQREGAPLPQRVDINVAGGLVFESR